MGRFSQGQQHPFLSMGQGESVATARFLQLTRLSPLVKEKILHGRRLSALRRFSLFRAIWRWQWEFAREKRKNDDAAGAIELLRQDLRFIEQYVAGDDETKHSFFVSVHRSQTLKTLRGILRKNAAQFGQEEVANCHQEYFDAKLNDAILLEATRMVETSDQLRPVTHLVVERPRMAAISLAVGLASLLTVIFLFLWASATVLARVFSSSSATEVSATVLWLAFPSALLITVTLFGLAPAEVIPARVQQWIATIGLLLGPLALLAFFIKRCFRQQRLQFSRAAVFWIVTLLSIYLGIFAMARRFDAFAQIPFDFIMPSIATQDAVGQTWLREVTELANSWRVTLHWLGYQGPHLTLVTWLLMLGALVGFSLRKSASNVRLGFGWIRNFVGIYSRAVAQSSSVLCVLSLLTYLSLAPSVVQMVEQDFQWRMSFARQPQLKLTQVKRAIEAMRADPLVMKVITEKVEASIVEDDARESAEESTAR